MADHLKEFGWEFIVMDAGWYYPEDVDANKGNDEGSAYHLDPYGRLVPDEIKFPSSKKGEGLKNLADYVHSKGLKFGIHIMRGNPRNAVEQLLPIKDSEHNAAEVADKSDTCVWNALNFGLIDDHLGSIDYYESIVELYADWGIDFIKIDDISRPYHKIELELFSNAVQESGRSMLISASPGPAPVAEVEHLRANVDMWRISNDVWDTWTLVKKQFSYCSSWSPHINGKGRPHADMLPLGKLRLTGGDDWVAGLLSANLADIKNEYSRLSDTEKYTMMNLLSIFKSPLILGGYLLENDSITTKLITNVVIIELNQESINNQEIYNKDEVIIWTAENQQKNYQYLIVFNISEDQVEFDVSLEILPFTLGKTLLNLWNDKTLNIDGILKVKLQPHESIVLRQQ